MLEEEKEDLEQLVDGVKEYIETRSELSKLKAVEKSSKMAGSIASSLILLLLALAILAFVSIAGAFALSEWIGRAYAGFLIVGGIYFVLLLILLLKKKAWIENPVTDAMIRNFFNNSGAHEKN